LGHYNLKTLNAWYLLLFASVMLVLIARDLLTFLLPWELMSILSYLLVTFERRNQSSGLSHAGNRGGEIRGGSVGVIVLGHNGEIAGVFGDEIGGDWLGSRRALDFLRAYFLWI
jgi:hypothetical protein